MKKVLIIFTLLMLYGAAFVQSQNADYSIYYTKIKEHIARGNCEKAQSLYNAFKTESGRTDATLAQSIEQCLNSRIPLKPQASFTLTINGVSFKMIYVQGGTYTMGEKDNNLENHPTVTVDDFWMMETEVTNALYRAVDKLAGSNNLPASFSYNNAVEFVKKINSSFENLSFSLPTEAEWEYAARGGRYSKGYTYSGSNNPDEVAWHIGNSGRNKQLVGQKKSNELGLYDMSGNVGEWCSDWYAPYVSGSYRNPTGPINGTRKVIRGGNYNFDQSKATISKRYYEKSLTTLIENYGIRLILRVRDNPSIENLQANSVCHCDTVKRIIGRSEGSFGMSNGIPYSR